MCVVVYISNIKISICIYVNENVKYVENIFKKIINQDFPDIELICIFNKSKTKFQNLIEEYQNRNIPIKIFSKNDDCNLLEEINGEFTLILDSNNWISSLNLNEIYNDSKKSSLDILLFSLDFIYDNINESIMFNFKNKTNYNIIFEMPKFSNNLYRTDFLKKNLFKIPKNIESFYFLFFHFSTLVSTSNIIFSKDNIFSKRIFNNHNIHESLMINFMPISQSNNYKYELCSENFFKNIECLINFFKENDIFTEYKYYLLNYIFLLLFNIYNLRILNDVEYFVYLKQFISTIYQKDHSNIVLILKPKYKTFYSYVLNSRSISELNLRYDYEKLIIKNEKLQFKFDDLTNFVDKFLVGRVDIKNVGNENNSVELIDISDKNALIQYPNWLKNNDGSGVLIQSSKGCIDFKIRCINDGYLEFKLRGIDFRNYNNTRIPIFIDFNNFLLNDEVIFEEDTLISHDNPFYHKIQVKHDEMIKIHLEWMPINEYNDFNFKIFSHDDFQNKLGKINSMFSARFDILNSGDNDNSVEIIEISDEHAFKMYPDWFKGSFGSGLVIQSSEGTIDFKIRCVRDGILHFKLRGADFRYNSQRIPLHVIFNKLLINDLIIFDKDTVVYHDGPFNYSIPVKDNDELRIHAEWVPINELVVNYLK